MIDFKNLKHVFPFFNELTESDVYDFLAHTQLKHLNIGEIFIKEGSLKSNVYFIKKGVIRSYSLNDKGEEITKLIRYENQLFAPYENILFGQPTNATFQAIEPTELFIIDFNKLREIIERNSKLESGRRFFVNSILAESMNVIDDFILLNPEMRYLKFTKEHPSLLNRVPLKYIANVLGITPVSLSRIRKRISNKK